MPPSILAQIQAATTGAELDTLAATIETKRQNSVRTPYLAGAAQVRDAMFAAIATYEMSDLIAKRRRALGLPVAATSESDGLVNFARRIRLPHLDTGGVDVFDGREWAAATTAELVAGIAAARATLYEADT